MNWFNRNRSPYTPEQLVRLVTTNDERSMLLTTSPFHMWPNYERRPVVQYLPIRERRIASIDPEEERNGSRSLMDGPGGRASTANNLRWPRPVFVPLSLVPRDFDDVGEPEASSHFAKPAQQTAESYFPVDVTEEECERFNSEIWTSLSYRLRCYAWSFWQRHLKNWWLFIRYPLAFGAALAYAITTVVHLARSHP